MEDMSAGTALQKMVESANIWIKDLMYELNISDPDQAWHVLRSVLQGLRDRLPPENAVQLGAQLPMIVRGMFYENWKLTDTPVKLRSKASFFEHVQNIHQRNMDVTVEDAVRGVFKLLRHHLSEGEAEKTAQLLPADIQDLWPHEQ